MQKPTKVLEGVVKVHVTDGDDDSVAILAPVEAALLQPLEVCGVPDLLLDQILWINKAHNVGKHSTQLHLPGIAKMMQQVKHDQQQQAQGAT